MIKEIYPEDIRNRIKVYFNETLVTPLAATCIYMSDQQHVTVNGWIDLVPLMKDKSGNILLDQFGNRQWLCEDTVLEDEYYQYNATAKELGETFIPRPKPAIWRWYGKIRWELVK